MPQSHPCWARTVPPELKDRSEGLYFRDREPGRRSRQELCLDAIWVCLRVEYIQAGWELDRIRAAAKR